MRRQSFYFVYFLMMSVELLCTVQNITHSTFSVLCGSFEMLFKNGNNFLY